MEDEIKEDFIQSEFRYCVVNWEIENYGYAAHGMKYELESPSFEVKPFTNRWRFVLGSDKGLCDDTEIDFYLERMDSDYEPVWVSYDVSLIDQNKKEWRGARGEHSFRSENRLGFTVPNIYYGKVNVSEYNFQFITIRCQMIVTYEKNFCFSRQSVDLGLKRLSKDMDKLYKSDKFTDVTIKLDNNAKIVAHKAILSARNKCMKNNLSENDSPVISCSSLHSDGMEQVLRYIYTGDIVNAVDQPSISVHDCINFLSIEELKIHFKASEIKLKSSIEIHQTGFMWNIVNFSDSNEKCIVSDLFTCGMLEMVWKLSLYPKGVDGNGEYLAVIAENVEGKINGDVWAKVEIYSDSFRRTWKTMKEVKQGEVFEISNLDERKSALEKLEEGSLRIGFKACVSVGVTHSPVDQGMVTIQRTSLEDYYKKLSNDIVQLRKDDKYSDVVIVTQNESFKAHKCILSVRSSKLLNRPGIPDENKTITLENIRSKTVEIILDYMYSGVIEMSDVPIIIEVYEEATKLGVNYLQQECSKYLRKNLNIENLTKIMTMAHEANDVELERETLTFSRVYCLKRKHNV